MQGIRIIEIPDCKMVSSGTGMFGEENFDRFHKWFSSMPSGIFPKDYLYFDGNRQPLCGCLVRRPEVRSTSLFSLGSKSTVLL